MSIVTTTRELFYSIYYHSLQPLIEEAKYLGINENKPILEMISRIQKTYNNPVIKSATIFTGKV